MTNNIFKHQQISKKVWQSFRNSAEPLYHWVPRFGGEAGNLNLINGEIWQPCHKNKAANQ